MNFLKNLKSKLCGRRVINPRALFYAFLAFLFGITLSKRLFDGQVLYIVLTVLAVAALLLTFLFTKHFKMLVAILVVFFAGLGWHFVGQSTFEGRVFSDTCAVVGRVKDDATLKDDRWSLTLDQVSINGQGDKNIVLYIYDGNAIDIKAGDFLAFESEISNVKLFELGTFNTYAYRRNAPYVASVNSSAVVASPGQMRYDEVIRDTTKKMLQANMSAENAGICYSVLFGDKSLVSTDTKQVYNKIGIVHILTVSGLHIGFLAALLFFLLKKCNKYVRFAIIFAVLLLYNILCGFSPSVLRASIMSLALCLASLTGRPYDSLCALSLAGFVILLSRPLAAFDVGFLMSFFSVMGIIMLYKRFFKLFDKFLPTFAAKYLAVTLSAQIGILPFASELFYSYNIVSPIANLVILPIFSVVFPVAFVVFVLSLVLPFAGALFHVVDWGAVAINYIAGLFAGSNTVVDLKPYPIVFSVLFCLMIFASSYFLMVEKVTRLFLLSVLVFALCCGLVVYDSIGFGKNKMHYASINSSEIVYVVNDSGQSLLICQDFDGQQWSYYKHRFNIKGEDYVVSFSDIGDEADYVKGFAYPNEITYGTNTYSLEGETCFEFGDYKIHFVYQDNTLVGVEYSVNNFKNFFAVDDYLSYNIKERLSLRLQSTRYAFCFLNKQRQLSCFDDSVTLGVYNTLSNDFSLRSFGNLEINFGKTAFQIGRID